MSKEKENIPKTIPSSEELEKHLLEKNPNIFKNISENKKEEIINSLKEILCVEVREEITRIKSSSMPFPEDLRGYYQIKEEYADIILKMSRDDQYYSQKRDNKIIENSFRIERRGQIFALVVSICAITGGVTCILFGYEISGTILGGVGLTGLVSEFLGNKYKNKPKKTE